MVQIGILASVTLAGKTFLRMLENWNIRAGITRVGGLNTCSGAAIVSMRPIVRVMKTDAAGIGPMKINALGRVASMLGKPLSPVLLSLM